MNTFWLSLGAAACAVSALATVSPEPLAFKAPAGIPDALELVSPASVRLEGYLGARVEANEANRLLKVEEEPILAGFRKKPGSHPWIGEHVGKWMYAATLAWANTGDAALRAKLDRVAKELIADQEPDGYLGTYVPEKRFGLYPEADWDVWSHKYNLMGLLTYYQYTGNPEALQACRKMGDLLIATFGPGKKSILSAGTHMGMAATSVLEPIVLLYRHTADPKYLEFARYLVTAWNEPKGPRIIEALLKEKAVNRTANAKAYEMLSNLVGLCELARASGDLELIRPVVNAWEDIVAHRLYITGSASQGEHFHADFDLPNQMGASVAETCVTVTWIQLNSQLLRLTGNARYGNELERTFYNHLSAAQIPDGSQWCYFTSLEGAKPYGPGINCCVSSGPRGMALVPQHAFLLHHSHGVDGIAANLFEPARFTAQLGGQPVSVEHSGGFPRDCHSSFTFYLNQPGEFGFRIRSPEWAGPLELKLNGHSIKPELVDGGWAEIGKRTWRNGDNVTVKYQLALRRLAGEHGNQGRAAVAWGPFVLAYDQKLNTGLPASVTLGWASDAPQNAFALRPGTQLAFAGPLRSSRARGPVTATLVPFADAGAGGGFYRVWLRSVGTELPSTASLLLDGQEERSRDGNASGSIIDGDPQSFVVTFENQPAAEDWFSVTLNAPSTIGRVVFSHGRSFHDGGWFDTSAGKPRIEIKRQKDSTWEKVAELDEYPATTAADHGSLKSGQAFAHKLANPVQVVAIRVIGKPASGDNSAQAFTSCGELEAFGE